MRSLSTYYAHQFTKSYDLCAYYTQIVKSNIIICRGGIFASKFILPYIFYCVVGFGVGAIQESPAPVLLRGAFVNAPYGISIIE